MRRGGKTAYAYLNASDIGDDVEHIPAIRTQRDCPPVRGPPPFLGSLADAYDSLSEGEERVQPNLTHAVLRKSYSEPLRKSPRPSSAYTTTGSPTVLNQDHHSIRHRHQRSSALHLRQSEKQALLDRVCQLSSSEAEAAAALARVTAENAALLDDIDHWREAAKNALAAQRAARNALAEESAENARLTAALNAQKMELEAFQAALAEERARSAELERALADAEERAEAYEIAAAAKARISSESSSHASSDEEPVSPPASSPTQGGANNTTRPRRPPTSPQRWDYERQELLSLLERLQEQLDSHAMHRQQHREDYPPTPPHQPASTTTPPPGAQTSPYQTYCTPRSYSVPEAPGSNRTQPLRAQSATPPNPARRGVRAETSFESDTTTPMRPPRAYTPVSAPARGTEQRTPPTTVGSNPQGRWRCDAQEARTAPPPRIRQSPSSFARSSSAHASASPVQASPTRNTPSDHTKRSAAAAHLKKEGDWLAARQRFKDAIQRYTEAVEVYNEQVEGVRWLAALLCARAAALVADGRLLEAAADCCRVIKAHPTSACRALFIKAKSFYLMGAFDGTAEDLATLLRMEGHREVLDGQALATRLAAAKRAIENGVPRNHYAVLGVKASASASEIKAAYRSLALKLHPDKAGPALGSEAATTLFSLLSAAHTTLGSAASRRMYDLKLLKFKYVMVTGQSEAKSGKDGGW